MAETAGGERARAQPVHLLQLRGPRSPAPRGCWPRRSRPAGSIPADIDEEAVAPPPLHRALARSRSPHPHLGRDADLQLPALAAGLRRAVRHPVLWPDFTRRHLFEAILEFQRRDRRFGRVSGLMDANLVRRVGFAVVAIPLALLIVWYGGLPLAVLLAVAGALATRELFDLAERQQIRPPAPLGLVSAAAIAPIAYAAHRRRRTCVPLVAAAWPYAAAVWLMLILTWALLARAPTERPLAAVGGDRARRGLHRRRCPAFLLAIRHSGHRLRSWAGAWLVFFPLVVTWVCDTAAMFGGRAIGGPKLAPTVSPGRRAREASPVWWAASLVAPLFGAGGLPAGRARRPALAAAGRRRGARRGRAGGRPRGVALQARGRRQGLEPAHSRTRRACSTGSTRSTSSCRRRRPCTGCSESSDGRGAGDQAQGVAVLGSTGSIGRSTLAVLRRQREHFRVVALTARPERRRARRAGGGVAAGVRGAGRARNGTRAIRADPMCWSRRRRIPTWTSSSTPSSAPPGSTRRWRRSGPGSGWRSPTRKRWSWRASWWRRRPAPAAASSCRWTPSTARCSSA